ncbi:5-oxoprolinase subunit PxpA, partial [Nostoc sp. NIES-2111]
LGMWTIGDSVDAEVMKLISSANIATGFHAGDPSLMDATVKLAKANGVGVGAHPGFRDLHGFGRRHIAGTAEELTNEVLYQVGALREFARRHGVPLQHVKPHGSLYMHAARDREFSKQLVDALQQVGPELYLFCMGVAVTYEIAKAAGQPVVREVYADREDDRSGSIVLTRRGEKLDPKRVADRVIRACVDGKVGTVEGDTIDIQFESICFHSDTPGALALARGIREALDSNGIAVKPVSQTVPR